MNYWDKMIEHGDSSSQMGAIQLTDIHQELQRLWNTEHGQKKIRASLFNLILYVRKRERIPFFQKLIKTVIAKFPCRVILILSEAKAGENYLNTSVSSETLGEGGSKIFCEIIRIDVAGTFLERVPFLILPHILPDLPVYLLWTKDPSAENIVLPHLEPLAQRIIFDSVATEDVQLYCRSMLSLANRFHCDVGDLNWSACSGWRHLFVQVFNPYDTFLSLTQSTKIRITYNSWTASQAIKHPELAAAYFQAWLASRLNWKFQSIESQEGNIRITYRRPLHEIIILLSPEEIESLATGTLLSIELESAMNKGCYNFKRDTSSRLVYIQYSDKDLCHIPYSSPLRGSAEGQEIVEEIFYPSGGKHYRQMLELLSTIPWIEHE